MRDSESDSAKVCPGEAAASDRPQGDPSYYSSLPGKQVSAGCVLMDGEGRVLLLNPTYKSGWDIPGGVVERNESPLAACCRELREELGLDVVALRLLGVDYRTAVQRVRGDALRFVFVGPQLTSDDIAGIRLDPAEHSEFGLVAVNALDEYLLPVAVRRLRALLAAESALYLEEGEAPSP